MVRVRRVAWSTGDADNLNSASDTTNGPSVEIGEQDGQDRNLQNKLTQIFVVGDIFEPLGDIRRVDLDVPHVHFRCLEAEFF